MPVLCVQVLFVVIVKAVLVVYFEKPDYKWNILYNVVEFSIVVYFISELYCRMLSDYFTDQHALDKTTENIFTWTNRDSFNNCTVMTEEHIVLYLDTINVFKSLVLHVSKKYFFNFRY